MDCYVLLDDHASTTTCPTSRLYTGFVREVRCNDPARLDELLAEVGASGCDGTHAVVLADYEWGVRLLGLRSRHGGGCLRVLLFSQLRTLDAAGVDCWLEDAAGRGSSFPAGILDVRPTVDDAVFAQAIQRVQAAIRDGETYQVNYTYRLDFAACGDPLALYRLLRRRQPVGYGALIALPPGGECEFVLSLSPELLLRNDSGNLTARPMKGTAARNGDALSDAQSVAALEGDKCRAENVMIVDLLRNDLGRIAEIGSVSVPQLFSVETYPSVFQMTSTVTARLRIDQDFGDVLRAVFPCGSVTGAPKHHTMELIDMLESTARGLYCGSIGWFDAPEQGRACGDFCLSVAIRTLCLGPVTEGIRRGRLGIGAGIVADSDVAEERAECETKASFLTGLGPGFCLFETMYATREAGIRHRERHLRRLAASAGSLAFAYPKAELCAALNDAVDNLPESQPSRLRLQLAQDGHIEVAASAIAPCAREPVRLLLAPDSVKTAGLILRHKTTARNLYDEAVMQAERQGAFDMLFFNQRGELTEGARSNVFVLIDGSWRTPAVDCGLLPGVMRGVLLEDDSMAASECILTLADLRRAEKILVCNALRGVLAAELEI